MNLRIRFTGGSRRHTPRGPQAVSRAAILLGYRLVYRLVYREAHTLLEELA